jgi:signal recognition particle receptor subunit beta
MKRRIYICDANRQIADIFKDRLSNIYEAETFTTLKELSSELNKNLPDLILLNPNILHKSTLSEEIFRDTAAIIYAEEMDVEEKLKYYQLGVRRVIIERIELIPTVTSMCSMILDRHANFRTIRQQSLNYGTLQGFSLQEILQNAFLEKKNLIIKVQNNGWDAKIRIFQGHIIDAVAPDLENEEAVLKMLHLPIGKFMIRSYRNIRKHSSVISSTPAILAELKFEQNKLDEFFKTVGSTNPKFELSSIKRAVSLQADEKIIVGLVKKYSIFQAIQLQSPFSVLRTVRILSNLFSRKLIYLEGEGEVFETFQDDDILYLEENVFPEGVKDGRIVILGVPGSGKTELIRKIAGQQQAKMQTLQYLDFTRIQLEKNLNLTLFGISIDENFQPIFDSIAEGMLAYIFLVDSKMKETFEYTKYLLNKMIQAYSVPCAVGITNIDPDDNAGLAKLRKKIEIPEEIQVLPVNPNLFKDALNLIYNLRKPSRLPGEANDNV